MYLKILLPCPFGDKAVLGRCDNETKKTYTVLGCRLRGAF